MEDSDSCYKKRWLNFGIDCNFIESEPPEWQSSSSSAPNSAPESCRVVPLELHFQMSEIHKFYNGDLDGTQTLTVTPPEHQSEQLETSFVGKIQDVRWLETREQHVSGFLSRALSFLQIPQELHPDAVEKITLHAQWLEMLEEDVDEALANNPLKLKVVIKKDYIWVFDMDAFIKKSLKRVRVMPAEADEEEEGGERKRRRLDDVVRENEVCPVCMEEFVAGSEVVSSMPCSHAFHSKCIRNWLERNHRNCPVCRFEIRTLPQNLDYRAGGDHS